MTDTAGHIDGFQEELLPGTEIEYEPLSGGKIRLAVYYQEELLHSSEYNTKIFGSDTLKGQFINKVKDSVASKPGVDTSDVAVALQEWFAVMNELDKDEQKEFLLTDEIQAIIDGTHYPVKVHGGETTTWHVTLTFAGRTQELEFTASEMVSGGSGALQEKIANRFFELVEIEKEDWEAIRERWQENKEVVDVVSETGADAVANRVLEYIGHNITPVADKGKLANSPGAAWYDSKNGTVSSAVPTDESVVWVQDSFLVDQLENAGKNLEYKSELIKTLNQRNDIYGVESDGRKRWPNPQGKDRAKFYAFDPAALGVSDDDVGDSSDPNYSEVEA